jgi:hypothetical protein
VELAIVECKVEFARRVEEHNLVVGIKKQIYIVSWVTAPTVCISQTVFTHHMSVINDVRSA